jgi:hypothetical protein
MNKDGSTSSKVLALADEVTAEIFGFLDAMDTVQCSYVCRRWNSVVKHSRSLWRQFSHNDYGLSEGDKDADWRAVYAYVYSQEQQYLRIRADLGLETVFLQSQLVFSDDGSPQPGNDPENALRRSSQQEACWCTNAFVDKDVDLVADLTAPHLVMAFCVANGSWRYSAPVRTALAFASMGLPDLEQARAFDGSNGEAWITLHRYARSQPPNGSDTTKDDDKAHPSEPLAGFEFTSARTPYNARSVQPCRRPTVARYVHFKLLSSFKCSDRVSNNIDVQDLHTFGLPLPRLAELLKQQSSSADASVPPDPSRYRRRYEIREYPWHIHDTFHQQRTQNARMRVMRGDQGLREHRQEIRARIFDLFHEGDEEEDEDDEEDEEDGE